MNIFEQVSLSKPKRNIFDLSHEKKLSFEFGQLIPIVCQEAVPGDDFRGNSNIFMRVAPMLAPIMHKVDVYTHYFFVPNRLLWDNWEDFITGSLAPNVDVLCYANLSTVIAAFGVAGKLPISSLPDYLGLPCPIDASTQFNNEKINLLPFKAYQLIYNEFYRDENLQDVVDLVTGSNTVTDPAELQPLLLLRNRSWRKDYFTSALPWAQKGSPVNLPLGTSAPVTGSVTGSVVTGAADLSQATSATINELRSALRIQEFLEKNARGGSRYIEHILAHFGVQTPDARLQRPEFLGGNIAPIMISEVLQTAPKTSVQSTPLGDMAGRGIAVANTNTFSYHCTEHGYIMGIMSVMPKAAYSQGLPRHFSRSSHLDFYWPEFANLGEQSILKKELYLSNLNPANQQTFGYTPRYSEYKYSADSVHGEFRDTLDFWHLARKFDTMPSLCEEFIKMDATQDDLNRIFAVTGAEHLYAQVQNNIKALRPMPRFATPTL